MATVTTATTSITAPVNRVLMRVLLRAAERVFPYYNGTVRGSLQSASGSLTVLWRRLENLAPATTALTELAGDQTAVFFGRTAATPTFTNITATVQKYGNFITHTEELDIVNVNSNSIALFERLGENAGHSLNVIQRDLMDGGNQIRYAGSVANDSAIGAAIALTDIQAAVTQLTRNAARPFFSMTEGSENISTSPIRDSYLGIFHADLEQDIRGLSGFVPVEQYATQTETFIGEFGAVGGVRCVRTQIAAVSTGAGGASANGLRGADVGSHDVYESFIYGQDAVGTVGLGTEHADEIYTGEAQNPDRIPAVVAVNHPPGSAGSADPFNEVGTLAWKAWHAGAILNNDWLVEVRTAATDHSL